MCRDLPVAIAAPAGEAEGLLHERLQLFGPVGRVQLDQEVVVRAERLWDEVAIERDTEGFPEKRLGLVRPVLEDQALRVQRAREDSRERQGLRDVECALDAVARRRPVAGEVVEPSQLRCEHRDVGIRLVAGEDGERRLHQLHGFFHSAALPERHSERSGDARAVVRRAGFVAQRERGPQVLLGDVGSVRRPCELAGALEQPGSSERLVGELRRVLERALRILRSGERGRAFACARKPLAGVRLDLGGIVGVRSGAIRIEQVRGDHLRDLVGVDARLPREVRGRGEVLRLAVAPAQRLVRDALDEGLDESVLAALGRARIGVEDEHLLAHERGEQRRERLLVGPADRGDPSRRERLAEHGRVLEELALVRLEPVEPRGDERVQRLRHVERSQVSGHGVARLPAFEQPAVEQHADRLDRVERDAVGALADARDGLVGQAGHETAQEVVDRLVGKGLERQRGEVAEVRAPAGMPRRDLRPGEGDDVDPVRARPVEQVLDELDECGIRPVDVLEDHDHRVLVGHPLDEEAPGGEEVLAVGSDALGEPEQMLEPRLDEGPLLGIGDDFLEHGRELRERLLGRLVLGDPCPHPDHLRERPVRDTVAVREAAALVPPNLSPATPSRYFSNSHAIRDLPMPGTPTIESRCARPSSAVAWKSSFTSRSSRSRPRNGGSRPAERPSPFRAATTRSARQSGTGSAFPLSSCSPASAYAIEASLARFVASPTRTLPGSAHTLDAGGGVDEVAGDHALSLGAEGDRGFAGEDARTRLQLRVEPGDGRDEVERGSHGPLGVVLLRDGSAPHGHDRVADELLDRSPVALDQRSRLLEVAGEELPRLLRVAALRGRGETDEVREEDRDETPFGGRRALRCRLRCGNGSGDGERGTALAAELGCRSVRCPARRARANERGPALGAELVLRGVLVTATRAGHAGTFSLRPARSSSSMRERRRAQRSRSATSRASARSGSASSRRSSAMSDAA